ncbi:MAG TPA: nuclear transport factor 2 family protein [Gemmatimonadaceae bacterium]|nr:nuclear transport factor 2 family protein [Gemmatimonadaceae bacterium]
MNLSLLSRVSTSMGRRARKLVSCAVLLLAGCNPAHSDTAASTAQTPATVEAELRRNTQALLDAVAPGDVKVWDQLLDSAAIQVDENDVVRDKRQILAGLTPLGPGLVGTLAVDDFRMVLRGDAAVVTHEDAESLDYHGQMIRSRFRNTDTWVRAKGQWRLLASQVLAVLQDPPRVHLDRTVLCGYAGTYAMTKEIAATLQCVGDSLVMKRDGRPDRAFVAEVRDVFFEPSQPRTRRIFQRDAGGTIRGFVDRREGRDIAWKRISDKH